MWSTAAYYCVNGHLWESTTSTWGHDGAQRSKCIHCFLTMARSEDAPGIVGPFGTLDEARDTAFRRGVRIKGPHEVEEWT